MKDTNNKYKIRFATRDDVVAINNIVNYYIDTSGANWAWEHQSLEEAYASFDAHCYSIHPIYVALDDEIVIGYSSLAKFRSRDGYWPVAENSIYLHPEYFGKGLGNRLMEKLLSHARESKLEVITAWIDSENKKSISFHEKYNFYHVGEMKDIGEKFNKRRSVTIMQLSVK